MCSSDLPIRVETIEQYKEYVDAVKYWQTIKSMTEREKKEICKGYADLIIRKEQLIRENIVTGKQNSESRNWRMY